MMLILSILPDFIFPDVIDTQITLEIIVSSVPYIFLLMFLHLALGMESANSSGKIKSDNSVRSVSNLLAVLHMKTLE